MFVNIFFASNPFIDAYIETDFLGKLIFLGLFALSICSWVIIAHKAWMTYLARKNAEQFYRAFEMQRMNPLSLECDPSMKKKRPNPFFDLYFVLKKHTLEILKKNRRFGQQQNHHKAEEEHSLSYMSPSDIDFVQAHLMMTVANQTKSLDKNLYILSTIVSLAPFLGLLGTVWGILTTFSDLQANNAGSTQFLGGISLALATTVLGLIDAIPAIIGYNYLKNNVRDFQTDMEGFSNELLASVEMYYRKVDVV